MFLKNLFRSVLILYCISTLECREYRYDYKYVPEVNGWIKIHKFPATWQNARLRCHFEAAVLASPETAQLLATLKSIAKYFSCGIYTGVHATFSPGDYFSVGGTPIERMPIEWAPDEPDNFEDSENCVILQSNGTGADVKCSEVYPYVCYKESPITLNECGTVDSGYNYDRRTGQCYKFHYDGRNWTQAFMACAAEGGHLAIINSNIEAQVVQDLYAKYPDSAVRAIVKHIAHIGIHNWGTLRAHQTIHGQSLQEAGYSIFEANQPDTVNEGVVCGGIFRSGGLDDFGCYVVAPFICEKSPDSLYTSIK